jgi:heme A synthase
MNPTRIKLILVWALLAAFCVAMCFHHRILAVLVFNPVALIIGSTIPRPKPSVTEQRIGYAFAGVLILFLVLALIHSFNPFPHVVVLSSEIVGALLLLPFAAYTVYRGYRMYKDSGNTNAAHVAGTNGTSG